MIKKFVCIVCPLGCNIEAETGGGECLRITGYACARGRVYGINECLHPVRTLTTTIFAGDGKMLPVKTDKPVPKELQPGCMKVINAATAKLPVKVGSVIIKNICGSGADVVAAKSMR
jgi:CxxC motif-containing protein